MWGFHVYEIYMISSIRESRVSSVNHMFQVYFYSDSTSKDCLSFWRNQFRHGQNENMLIKEFRTQSLANPHFPESVHLCQGYGSAASATRFRDCLTKKKIKKTCSHLVTWRPVAPASVKPCETQNLCLVDCTKCRSTLLIRIWIFAFCLCTTLFFCPTVWNRTLLWHWWFLCAVACPASRDIDYQVTAWRFRCPFSPYSVTPRQGTWWGTNVCAGRIDLHLTGKFVIRHRSAKRFRNLQGKMKNTSWWIFWLQSTLPNMFHLQWSCLKSILLITRVARVSSKFSHGSVLFYSRTVQKCVTQIIYLGPLPTARHFLRNDMLVEADFSIWRDYGQNKRHYRVHHVWCLDQENMKDFFEKVWDYQVKILNCDFFVASIHVP